MAGVRVDLDSVYARASVLGFTKEEIDDILQAIEPQDMRGTVSAEDAADRLLSSVYLAIVSDVGETQGLTPPQVGCSQVIAARLGACPCVAVLLC